MADNDTKPAHVPTFTLATADDYTTRYGEPGAPSPSSSPRSVRDLVDCDEA